MPHRSPSRRLANAVLALYAAAWLALVAVPPIAFLRWRATRLAEVSAPVAQEDWDRFRADMRAESVGPGPVRRKVPRSAEPPERIWLRDYPLVAVTAWIVFVGLLGAVIGFLLRGAIRGPGVSASRISDRG